MANGTPLSSGLALSDTLQQMLTRDRELKRQTMLDELARKQTEQNMSIQQQNADAMSEWRKGQAAQQVAQANERYVSSFDEGEFGIGDNLKGRFSPEVEKALFESGRLGKLNPTAGANAGSGMEEDFAEGVYSMGSPKTRQRAARQQGFTQLIQSGVLTDPNKTPAEKMIAIQQAFPDDQSITGTELKAMAGGDTVPHYRIDAQGRAVFDQNLPANSRLSQVDRPPVEPNHEFHPEVDPKTGIQTGRFFAFNPKTRKMELIEGPLPVGTRPPPPATTRTSPRPINDGVQQNLAKLSAEWSRLARQSPTSNMTLAAKDAYVQALRGTLNNANLDPNLHHVKQAADAIIVRKLKRDPNVPKDIGQIIADAKESGAFKDDHEVAVFANLLQSILPTIPELP
jgi:hypothetical protein